VSEYLGIDVDVSILEANDFLTAQIGVLMKIMEDNEVKLEVKDEQRRELAELGAKLDPARGAPLNGRELKDLLSTELKIKSSPQKDHQRQKIFIHRQDENLFEKVPEVLRRLTQIFSL